MSQKEGKKYRKNSSSASQVDSVGLRIIGGTMRGRKLAYAGDRRVRPMKDRVREAVFNLIGKRAEGKFALDLFGGTGAVCLEAISRGAKKGLLIEMHFPTAKIIEQNIETLGLQDTVQLHVGSVFIWNKKREKLPTDLPWLVFVCPPYAFFVERWPELETLIRSLWDEAPKGSVFLVETDERFNWDLIRPYEDEAELPWDIRTYAPATVGLLVK